MYLKAQPILYGDEAERAPVLTHSSATAARMILIVQDFVSILNNEIRDNYLKFGHRNANPCTDARTKKRRRGSGPLIWNSLHF